MNNKIKTYLLLLAVLSIWGIIGFKVFSTLNPESPATVKDDNIITFSPKSQTKIDTFSIKTVSRDPFLGTLYKAKKVAVKASPKPLKSPLVWPTIIYHGAVARQQSKMKVFVVSINGNQHIMKVGQEIADVKLLRAVAKSITVRYKGVRKTIVKI